jgi:hypothetical protein
MPVGVKDVAKRVESGADVVGARIRFNAEELVVGELVESV